MQCSRHRYSMDRNILIRLALCVLILVFGTTGRCACRASTPTPTHKQTLFLVDLVLHLHLTLPLLHTLLQTPELLGILSAEPFTNRVWVDSTIVV
ncbi:hypothetical protein GGR57DRAFT_485525 [Xylariaceae sp. FL1272]|nr:hypothetical protein GGR57DRAFT_485525 [Xylariaceae sp. FL1272]